MVYHCTQETAGCATACDCPLLPLRSGPVAGPGPGEQADVVDETLAFFRANVLFRSFDICGGGDKLLLYLTLYISAALQRLVEAQASRAQAEKLLYTLAHENFKLPGQAGFPLGGLLSPPKSPKETEAIRAYLRQVREAAGQRLIAKCYTAEGGLSKWWAAFGSRRFLGKAMA